VSNIIHIAIDGPVASGKGSVARQLSEKLGIPCLDTGALYRGVAVFVREQGQDKLGDIKMTAKIIDGATHVYLDKKDVTAFIRDNDISRMGSQLATIPSVRALCTGIAQGIAKNQSLIAEGRDICNVVLPNAKYKFYIDGHVKVRAARRHRDLVGKGESISYKEVLKQTKQRDKVDRKKGGFKKISGAIRINATNMTVDENVQHMLNYITEWASNT